MPQSHAALLDTAWPSSPVASRSDTRARTSAGGRPWTSKPPAPDATRSGKAASRRRAAAGH
eukprot:1720918-Alexandrium_andersonii.AAC.1